MAKPDTLLKTVADYYSAKLAEHGESPRGVDWNGEESQLLRFKQLCHVIDGTEPFSINDLGCGYGALVDYLTLHYGRVDYTGYDVSETMVKAAAARYPHARFAAGAAMQPADYSIASGIFNVRLQHDAAAWQTYVEATLDTLDAASRKGFAFNCLTSYSDADKMRPDLYYADPCALFDRCKRRYSRHVALLHDYGLYEFTILVRKSA